MPTFESNSQQHPADTPSAELERLKRIFLQKTEILDRATNHLESLTRAMEKGNTPAKLRITVKPLVVKADDPLFQKEWADAITDAQSKLITTIQRHLGRTARTANLQIREETDKIRIQLSTSNTIQEVDAAIKNTLDEANRTRKHNNEQRIKRKLENQQKKPQQTGKKTKRDN